MQDGLMNFDEPTQRKLREMLIGKHIQLAQLDRPPSQRSLTARNYDSSLKALGDYLTRIGASLPTKGVLEQWRDDMQAGINGEQYAIRTINARLAAARKLLRGIADDVLDFHLKIALRDWAGVTDAKAIVIQDKTERDYGVRLSLAELEYWLTGIPSTDLRGLRDRALIAVLAGAGLRLSEAMRLTLADVYEALSPEQDIHGIRVQRGKHNKSRMVILGSWDNWVLRSVDAYVRALGFDPHNHAERRLFYRLRRKEGRYVASVKPLSIRGAQHILQSYPAQHRHKTITLAAHDLRRTYAKLCQQAGMTWDALRENMGHSSVRITEDYVGRAVDYRARLPQWSPQLSKNLE